MIIIGCDFHTRYQQIAMANDETGELLLERRLDHQSGEAHAFYRSLQGPVRVAIEATGPIHWFECLLAKLGHELWIADAAKIRASEVRKQETDERDAALILAPASTNRRSKRQGALPPVSHPSSRGPRKTSRGQNVTLRRYLGSDDRL